MTQEQLKNNYLEAITNNLNDETITTIINYLLDSIFSYKEQLQIISNYLEGFTEDIYTSNRLYTCKLTIDEIKELDNDIDNMD